MGLMSGAVMSVAFFVPKVTTSGPFQTVTQKSLRSRFAADVVSAVKWLQWILATVSDVGCHTA